MNGIVLALAAAALFGAGTPAAKALLAGFPPQTLAGLLYLGAGAGLAIIRVAAGARRVETGRSLDRRDLPWLAGAIATGGMLGPLLLMLGLSRTPAAGASLLLNMEAVWTGLLAALLFGERVTGRVWAGMGLIWVASAALSWEGRLAWGGAAGPLLVALAALCWGADNNLTRRIAGGDALLLAALKGLVAGAVNTGLGLWWSGGRLDTARILPALALGFLSYGLSLWLYILALRALGAARTAAWFGLAPFAGAVVAVAVWREPVTAGLVTAAAGMAGGAWLLLGERHRHAHAHGRLVHRHPHWPGHHPDHAHG